MYLNENKMIAVRIHVKDLIMIKCVIVHSKEIF